ncbi:MAG: GNAT family N-acetyltransferase [Pseudomonadota bacterium]
MKPRTITIRRAHEGDLGRLNEIIQSSSDYAGEYRAMLDGYAVTSVYLERNPVFVAEAGKELVGFYALLLDSTPELDLMFVADEAQGQGIGATLFEHMAATAGQSGAAAVRIVSHPPSANFYERMGAERIGTKQPQGRVAWSRPILELRLSTS